MSELVFDLQRFGMRYSDSNIETLVAFDRGEMYGNRFNYLPAEAYQQYISKGFVKYGGIIDNHDMVIVKKYDRSAYDEETGDCFNYTVEEILATISPDGRTLTGNAEDENISNSGNNVNIYGNGGNDIIDNSGSNVNIYGNGSKIDVSNSGDHVKIIGSDAADSIQLFAVGDGAGRDWISDYNTIDAGGGDDLIDAGYWNSGGNWASIDAGLGNDSVYIGGHYATAYSGLGNDYINAGYYGTIYIGAKNGYYETIDIAKTFNHTINVAAGSNEIKIAEYLEMQIAAPQNNATVLTYGDVLLNSGSGNDTIYSDGRSCLYINAGEGMDSIYNSGSNVTIDAGVGNDTVKNSGEKVQIYSGMGDDVINNSAHNVTIFAGSNNKSLYENEVPDNLKDCYVIVNAASSNDTIHINEGQNVVMNAPKNNVQVNNNISGVLVVNAGGGKDKVYNYSENLIINAGSGDDHIGNNSNNVTINAGTGKDSIYNEGNNISIDATDDNLEDIFYNEGNSVTINAGGGNNSISLLSGGFHISVNSGDGNDSITDFGEGKFCSWEENLNINAGNGNNFITLGNGWMNATIKTGEGKDTIISNVSSTEIESGAENDSILSTGDHVSINAGSGENIVNNGNFKGHTEVFTSILGTGIVVNTEKFFIDESVMGGTNVTIETGENDDSITSFGGSNVSISTGNGENTVRIGGNGISSIEVQAGNDNDSIITYGESVVGNTTSNGAVIKESSGEYLKINAGGGNNFVSVSGNWNCVTIIGGNVRNKIDDIHNDANFAIINGNAGHNIIENSGNYSKIYGGNDTNILLNYGNSVLVKGGDNNDYIQSDNGNDITIDSGEADDVIEIYHDVRASISAGNGADEIFLTRVSTNDSNELRNGLILEFGTSIIGLIDKIKIPIALSADVLTWVFATANKFFGDKEIPYLGKAGPWITAASGAVSIIQRLLPDSLLQQLNTTESTVNAGLGDDTIFSDGFGARIFEYKEGDGKDIIYHFTFEENFLSKLDDFAFGENLSTLHITEGLIKEVQVDGTDVIFKIGEGSIKLVDAADRKFNLKESDGTLTTRAYGKDDKTGELICSIWGAATDEVIKDTINAENTHYVLYGDRNAIGMASGISVREDGKDELHGNAKNDSLYGGIEDSLHGYGGNDVLYGKNKSLLDGGSGNDIIYSGKEGSLNSLHPTIPVGGNNNKIYGGIGNDIIYNYGNGTFIDAGDNDDQIYNYGTNFYIEGNAQILGGNKVTVNGGKGNDIINLYIGEGLIETFINYANGDGNDIIYGFNETSKIKIIGAEYSTSKIGNDFIITVGNGSITLKDSANIKININGQTVSALPQGFSIDGNKLLLSKDFSRNFLDVNEFTREINIIDATEVLQGVQIFGNSSINLFKGSKFDDIFYSEPPASNDSFASKSVSEIETPSVTIQGGGGNDTIYGGDRKTLYEYAAGDGNDVIYEFSKNDTLQISGGDYTSIESNGDVILTVGEGSITLKDAKNIPINVDGNYGGENISKGRLVSGTKKNDTLIGGAGDDTFTGDAGNDIFVYSGGNDIITDYAAGKDKISLSGGTVKNSTINGADIILYADGGSINVKNGKNKKITVIDGNGKTTTEIFGRFWYYDEKTAVSLNSNFSGTLKATDYDSNVEVIDASQVAKSLKLYGNDNANTIIGGAGKDTLYGGKGADTFVYNGGSNDVIADFTSEDSIDLNGGEIASVSLKSSDMIFKIGANTLTVKNGKNKEFAIGEKIYYNNLIYTADKKTAVLNKNFSGTLKATDYNSSIEVIDASQATKSLKIYGNDNANTIIGGSGKDTLYGGKGADTFVYNGGGNDVIADFMNEDSIDFNGGEITSASLKSSDMIFKIGANTLTVKNGKNKEFDIGEKVYYNNLIYTADKKNAVLNKNFSGTLKATDYNSSIEVIDASQAAKSLKIYGNDNANTIIGGAGKDTLYGGKGADTFVYSGSNDVIADFTNEDSIDFNGGEITSASLKSSDMIFKIGANTLTVKNGKNKEFDIGEKIYYNNLIYTADKKNAVLNKNFSGTLKATDYDSSVEVIDASQATKSLKIYGNDNANTIIGGAGKDTLYGGKGADTFVYSGSNDVIADFTSEDSIKLDGNFTVSYSTNKSDAILKIGSGSLTLKNAANAEITVVDSSGYASVFGAAVSANLFEDNNFIDGNTIDALLESSDNSITNLTQENSFNAISMLPNVTQIYFHNKSSDL